MQTYDVMCLDINIFPLIRQNVESTSARAASQWENYYSRLTCALAHMRSIVEIFHLVPSITRSPLKTEETTERSSHSRSTNREDRAVPRTHRIASRRIGKLETFYATRPRQSFRHGSHKDAFTERYVNASAIYLTHDDEGRRVDNATRAKFLSRVAEALTRFMRQSTLPRRKPMRFRDFMFITADRT